MPETPEGPEWIPFPPAVAGVLEEFKRQIAEQVAPLVEKRNAYVTGALAMVGVERFVIDFDAFTYRPTDPAAPDREPDPPCAPT